MRRSFICTCVIGLCAASAAHATSLDTLRATLSAMHADTPLSARLNVQVHQRSGKKDAPKSSDASAVLRLRDSAAGLDLRYSAALLTRAAAESRAQAVDADAPTPTRDALGKLDPTLILGLADFAPVLTNKLTGARLTAHAKVMRDGKPVERLTFSVPSHVGAENKDALKHYAGSLKVWLGADGIPVAVQESREYTGSKFFISFAAGSLENDTLRRIGQRLVVVRYTQHTHGSGLGHTSRDTLDITLQPQPPGTDSSGMQ